MKDKLTAIRVNLISLLRRIEELDIARLDYNIIALIQKIELKIDELNDLIMQIEAREEL